MLNYENILAIASAPAHGPVGLIRLSGPHVLEVLQAVFKPFHSHNKPYEPRKMVYGKLYSPDQQVLDEVMAVYFKAPFSFTGEDVVELHTHGNLILLNRLIRELWAHPFDFELRLAEPGEFTKRAFLNGKMDLTQAEAIHDLITSESEASLKANLNNLSGSLSHEIQVLRDNLTSSLALVEASFEFPEEDIQTYDAGQVKTHLQTAYDKLTSLIQAFQTSQILDQGFSVALVGEPNVGKSSLLNALLKEDKAIVTDIAGTTRDVVEGVVQIDGIRFVFRDTAGLRQTDDVVESIGIQKSDVILHMTDQIQDLSLQNTPKTSQTYLKVLNKWDELQNSQNLDEAQSKFDIIVSAKNGYNLSELIEMLRKLVQSNINVQNNVHINSRQHHQILKSLTILTGSLDQYESMVGQEEVLAEELRHAVSHLDEITGHVHSEDILGEIFQKFCIGK